MSQSDDEIDSKIEAAIEPTLRRIEATKALYEVLLALERKDGGFLSYYTYSEAEKAEFAALHRRHLLRRARQLAAEAGIVL